MNIQFALDGKTRDKPVADDYLSALEEVLKATDPRLGARIVSAGQSPKGSGGKRTGSTRHDVDHTGHSHTSDLVLTLDGKEIRPGDDKGLYARFLKNAAPKFPGIGHYDWGVHIGDGTAAMWGPDRTSKSIDPIFAKAITEGRSGENMPAPARKKVTDPSVLAKLNGSTVNPKNNRPNLPNDDGSFSTEVSITVTNPRLNGGRPTNIPSIWDGKRFDPETQEDAIVEQALNSGKKFPAFASIDEAVTAAKGRSESLGAGVPKRKKVTDPSVLAKLNGEAPVAEVAPDAKVDPATNQPAGVPEFNPVGVDGYDPQTGEVTKTGVSDKIGAFLTSVPDIPVVGPALVKGQRAVAAGIAAPFADEEFGQIYDEMGAEDDRRKTENPGYALAGQLTGTLGTLIPAGATSIGGRLLGTAGNSLRGRMAMSGASNMLMSGADIAVRGGDVSETIKSGGISGLIGLAIPAAGAGMNALGRGIKETVGPRLNALIRPSYEAERRVGAAVSRDAANAPVLSQADEASAALNNQNLLNVDRGGETTRALARSAANADPEARALIEKTASDRFGSQGDRAQSFIQRITGGATDDLALKDALSAASRKANKPAYDAAFSAPAAADMATPELMTLLKSPALRQAASAAETRGANRAVIEGFETVRNPFVFDEAGNASMREGVRPTLQFWDQVKRNLDSEIGKAQRAGDKTLAADMTGLKSKLVSELDTAVPEYATARQGAAAFFGAEDAMEAGKKFVTQNRTIDETKAALAKMSPAERSTFAVGFASEMKDAIAQAGDRTNVINKIFGSQQARDKIKLALGAKAYGEFEQFVKVEHSMDLIRSAMGNSTTARQLIEMGLAGGTVGTGTALYTGDWKSGVTAAVLTGLARKGGAKIDERITKSVAKLLLSDDPAALQKAVTLASNSPKAAAAVSAIQSALSTALKGTEQVTTRPEPPRVLGQEKRQPLEITVGRP